MGNKITALDMYLFKVKYSMHVIVLSFIIAFFIVNVFLSAPLLIVINVILIFGMLITIGFHNDERRAMIENLNSSIDISNLTFKHWRIYNYLKKNSGVIISEKLSNDFSDKLIQKYGDVASKEIHDFFMNSDSKETKIQLHYLHSNIVYAYATDHKTLLGAAIAIPGNYYIVAINNSNVCDAKIETSEILLMLEQKLISMISKATTKSYKDSNISSFYETPKQTLENPQWPRPNVD